MDSTRSHTSITAHVNCHTCTYFFPKQTPYLILTYIMPILYGAYINLNAVSRIVILQKKTLRMMNFQSGDSHSSPLFKSNLILKFEDKILTENILFINKSFNNLLPPIFKS